MRILHTADWHLGRLFHGVHLTEDQAFVLERFVELAREARPDVVVVAGDVYDRAVPPPEAVELLDDTLARLVLGCGLPTVVVAGNHDSPSRLGFGSRLFRERGLYVVGEFGAVETPTAVLEDADGPVALYAIPYAEPARVREGLGVANAPEDDEQAQAERAAMQSHDGAMRATTERIRQARTERRRSILIAHAFVAGGSASESERPLSVGGADAVAPEAFAGFDYVALGHLHRPQAMAEGRLAYAGSLLKYSFGEVDQKKSVSLIEMDGRGACRAERIALAPRRDVRRLAGTLADLLRTAPTTHEREDYLMVTLLDKGPVFDAIGRLREAYPNVLHLERPQHALDAAAHTSHPDRARLTDLAMFEAFFQTATAERLDETERTILTDILERLRREERETPE